MYQGEEKRKTMDNELNEIKVELASFTATVKEWMNGTTQYRLDLCRKQDKLLTNQDQLTEKFNALPCSARSEVTKGMKAELNWVRALLGVVLLALAGLWLK